MADIDKVYRQIGEFAAVQKLASCANHYVEDSAKRLVKTIIDSYAPELQRVKDGMRNRYEGVA